MNQEPQLTPAQQALMDFFNEFAAAPTATPGMLERGYSLLDEAVEENRRLTDSITDATRSTLQSQKGERATMTLSTSSHPLGYYTSYTPGCGGTLDQLQERYGSRLEGISHLGKQMLRATLASYVIMRPIWDNNSNSVSCADCCIVGAGGDDYNIWVRIVG